MLPSPAPVAAKSLWTSNPASTQTRLSAGLTRQYIIDIPANYDKNKPYRLIFAMHYMGGSMNTMVKEKFYGLKTYAERDNVPVIFVAPQGYTDQMPWRGRDDKDHVFFADMLALFKDKLSVDTSRIFCCGFSFGAMFTYSLSLEHQKDLRAVACYAPANWNIYLPTNTAPTHCVLQHDRHQGRHLHIRPLGCAKTGREILRPDAPRRQRGY